MLKIFFRILFFLFFVSPFNATARNILSFPVFYLTPELSVGKASFWVIDLGNYNVALTRKFPGGPEEKIQASVRAQLISSGYVEFNGYSPKGKVDGFPSLVISTPQKVAIITADQVAYIYDRGRKVALNDGTKGDLYLDFEGQRITARNFILREFRLTTYYGEEILKEGSRDVPIAAIIFRKEKDFVVRARKDQGMGDR